MTKGLFLDLYELTMAQAYFQHKPNAVATFDLFIRSRNRPFYVACGIDDALKFAQELHFTKEDIDYLRELKIFNDDFLEYLRGFAFKGEIWAVEEPEIVFPQEPLVRVTANLIEAQLLESAFLNKINLGTTLATKAARVVIAAQGKAIYDFSLRRTQGLEAALASAKYSYITGAKGTSNVYAGFLYKIPVSGTMAHSFVMSFEREIESFMAFAKTFPNRSILLVDTYDTKKGIDTALKVAQSLKKEGYDLLGLRFDSGDIAHNAKYARNLLDKEGLVDACIFATGNLDEHAIKHLLAEKAPIDAFGVGTHMGCSSDLPFTDVIYKLVEINDGGKEFIPTMKLSTNKTTLPCKKQVLRIFGKNNGMEEDIITLENEKSKGKKLLIKVIEDGKRICREKSIEEKRKCFSQKVKTLPDALAQDTSAVPYPVIISKKLTKTTERISLQIKKQFLPRVIFFDIDTQYDFMHPEGSLYVKDSTEIIANIKKLTRYARSNKILIVSSLDTHREDDAEFKQFPPHCIDGSKGHKKIRGTLLPKSKFLDSKKIYSLKELKDISHEFGQIILPKNVFDVFSNPNTLNVLESQYPDQVYVYGVAADYSLKEAVEGLIKAGFNTLVVKDAIKEVSDEEKEKLFALWKKKGVSLITTKILLETLAQIKESNPA